MDKGIEYDFVIVFTCYSHEIAVKTTNGGVTRNNIIYRAFTVQ